MVSMRWDNFKLWGQKLIVAKVLVFLENSLCGLKSWFIKIIRIISEPLFLNRISPKPRQGTYNKSYSNITSIAPVSLSPKQVHIQYLNYSRPLALECGTSRAFYFQRFASRLHHINILLKNKFHSTSCQLFLRKAGEDNRPLDPWYVTGFTDAEGCFNILIAKSPSTSIGWRVQARFIIELHIKDIALLRRIKSFFNDAGTITILNTKNIARYSPAPEARACRVKQYCKCYYTAFFKLPFTKC